ncbi:MAG: zinc ABC transporter substrate-binding protein [Treponema sp.]|nr:zinc ABC transporter substrate-binding protein [Treponema sp.]
MLCFPSVRSVLKRLLALCVFLSCFGFLFESCRRGPLPDSRDIPVIAVSILPQSWFVSRIAGDRARTLVLAGQGQNPHNYEPAPKQIASLGEAAAWILSGTEFEIALRGKIEALFPGLRIVDGTRGLVFRLMEDADDGGEHNIDRHTWLGEAPAKILAGHVRDLLVDIDPDNAEFYRENYADLVADIEDVFDGLREELAPLRGRSVFVYHPSFGYFLDEFGIKQEAVETGGKEPGPRELNILIEKAKREKAAAIFVQSQFPVSAAAAAAGAAGAEIILLDPLDADWIGNIRRMGDALKKALGGV